MSALRERLAEELATKVERHGVVVWDDPEAAYSSVADEVAPPGTSLHKFDGSWFELRHCLEKSLAGHEIPNVVAYVPSRSPDPDPLEELRAIGTRFRVTLPTLIKQTLEGQLSQQRIVEIGQQCSTITEAEAALEAGDVAVDARLISIVGESDTAAIAAEVIGGSHESELAQRDLTKVVQSMLADAVGGDFVGLIGPNLRRSAFRQVVLAQLVKTIGELPGELVSSLAPATPHQRKIANAIIDRLQTRRELRGAYTDLAADVDQKLHLGLLLPWNDSLRSVDFTPGIEAVALDESFRLLDNDEYATASALASERLASSWWLKPWAPGSEILAIKYRAVRALAELGLGLEASIPTFVTVEEVRDWYVSQGCEVDAAYRRSELIRVTSGVVIDELDDLFHRARQRYETWLDQVLRAVSAVLPTPDLPADGLQRSVHHRFVRNHSERTAYVLVDALRYELGTELVRRLGTVKAEVQLLSAFGTPPSITPVGMAAVLPGADVDFGLRLNTRDRLEPLVAGNPVLNVDDRVKQLEHAHGQLVNVVLDEVAQWSNKELKRKLGSANFVLVRSTEIDAGGESDQLAASWGSFDMTLSVLQTVVAKLLHAGVQRVVITADHGFLAVRELGEERRIDKPKTGIGELHRRVWIGRGGTTTESTIKVPLAAFGIAGDLEVITPRGLGVFAAGGGLQFFHGGLSPQEIIVPVVIVEAQDQVGEPQYQIDLAVAGGKISTGVVAVTVTMTGDLFTRESRIRLQLVQEGNRVGRVVGGDGFDPATDTIDASVETARVITLQITANLLAGSAATLEVLDAATGVRLESLDVDVAAFILMEDELD